MMDMMRMMRKRWKMWTALSLRLITPEIQRKIVRAARSKMNFVVDCGSVSTRPLFG